VTKHVLLLSGTSEGPPLARALLEAGFAVRATVTRAEACTTLFGSEAVAHASGSLTVEVRGFTEEGLSEFLARDQTDVVLDATHPFAVRITRLAHAVCVRLGIPFVRYERPDWEPPPETRQVDSFAEAAALLPSLGRRVLLTIGAKQLKHFVPLQDRLTLIARILPCVASLQQALAAGFTPDRLLCLRPPFSQEFNRALLREYRAEVLVTKASGREGGVVEKVLAAHELGIEVVMIRRPQGLDIPNVGTLAAAVQACRERTGGA
jgi:precorrin-6A/cobalt-precorrin-6A reductase